MSPAPARCRFALALALRLVLGVVATAGCGADVSLGGSASDAGRSSETGSTDACGPLAPPDASADCRACNKGAADCQPNGCYGGYACNLTTHDCRNPLQSCL